jgi:hypothetical protein
VIGRLTGSSTQVVHVSRVRRISGLESIRRHVPLVVFLLILVLVVLMIGFACACFGDGPLTTTDRAAGASIAMPALIEMWAALAIVFFAPLLLLARKIAATGRGSPAVLQCFLR